MNLLLFGLGDLGTVLLELIIRSGTCRSITVASRSDRAQGRLNAARLSALLEEQDCDLAFLQVDLQKKSEVAHTVASVGPNIIVNTASCMTWWLTGMLPMDCATELSRAGFGLWLPLHLLLPLRLMQTLRDVQFDGWVVNGSYPDVVNYVLAESGLAPTTGFGNVETMATYIQHRAATRLRCNPAELTVFLVAPHSLYEPAISGNLEAIPDFALRVEHNGNDVTDQLGTRSLLAEPYELPPGRWTHFLAASSGVRLIRALNSETPQLLHLPGPLGLPGGYPALVSRSGVRPLSLPGLSLEDAKRINERGNVQDGISHIEEGGTVVFTSEAACVMRTTLGYDCERLPVEDIEVRALELRERFQQYAGSKGVDLRLIEESIRF